jgi:hypothetical protein
MPMTSQLKRRKEKVNRTVSVDRLYSLGDYKNIRFSSTIDGIIERLALDKTFMDKLLFLQMLDIESSFRTYKDLAKKIGTPSEEEALKILEDFRQTTLNDLKQYLEK